MKSKFAFALAAIVALSVFGATSAFAQTVTTGNLSGKVADQQGGVLPGATVLAVHTPTGTQYQAVTDVNGQYVILNVRVGSPYKLTVTMSGFMEETVDNIVVTLGEATTTNFTLKLKTVSEAVTVTAYTTPIDVARPGAAANISQAVKETLPTISRSMIDIVRINPYFNAIAQNANSTNISVAGRNARYNNIQIDGAVNNDLFGLSDTGTPGGGGQTETQPISLDAIQELQLVVSPYDVRQGGFSGGGINVVTKSGSNRLTGSAFFFGRSEAWIGKGVTNTPVADFADKQGGFSVGGKIVQNKAFFFGNMDWGRKSTPTGFCIRGCPQAFRGTDAEVDRYFDILENKYGYTIPNARDEFSRTTDSDKYIAKFDFNVRPNHRLTVRHNYVNAQNDLGLPSTTTYITPDGMHRFRNKTNSTVAQLNSTLGNAVNEFRVAFTSVRDRRGGQPFEDSPFPRISVRMGSFTLTSGREAFSAANELDQNIVELHDDYTMIRGKHTITLGTHNEFFGFRNLFIRDNFGTYTFNSLDKFDQGLAQQFDHSFSATQDPRQATRFSVNQIGFYVGDTWRVNSVLTLTTGMRVDVPMFPDKPTANPQAEALFGYATDVVPGGAQYSPRIGFNFAPRGDATEQIRGGIGLFNGRTPYVWLSNQFGNTGIEFTRIGASNSANNNIPFQPDPFNQPHTVTGATGTAFQNEIDLLDPDYKYPSIMRGNLAYDRELPWGLVGTAEVLFTNDVQDIKYQNLNRVPCTQAQQGCPGGATTLALDGRQILNRLNTGFSDVIFLTNSGEGHSYSTMFEVRKPFRNRWFAQGSYIYGVSKSIMDGNSSQAASNWGNVLVPDDPSNPPLARSSYDPGHRINFSGSYEIPVVWGITTTISAYYSGQSGRPYTLMYFGDINGDGRTGSTSNDLQYTPASANEVTFTGGTYQDLLNFMQADDCLAQYVGKVIPRNACRAPWSNQLDMRFNFGLPFQRVKAEITLDLLNVINLLDSQKGVQQYASFNAIQPVTPTLTNGQVTNYNIAFMTAPTFQKFQRDDLRSRWQMQLGGRIRF